MKMTISEIMRLMFGQVPHLHHPCDTCTTSEIQASMVNQFIQYEARYVHFLVTPDTIQKCILKHKSFRNHDDEF